MIMLAVMVMALALLGACGGGSNQAAEESADTADDTATEATVDGTKYGYDGDEAIDAAVYKYLCEEVSKNYDAADASVPIVTIIGTDTSKDDDTLVWGDFHVYNYNVDGDTLKCVSGGSYPGVMHLAKNGDAYKQIKEFYKTLPVEDGGNFEDSAKELFGEKYDNFMKIYSDEKWREETRGDILAVYVKANGLDVTKYQDEGWDPVDIPL